MSNTSASLEARSSFPIERIVLATLLQGSDQESVQQSKLLHTLTPKHFHDFRHELIFGVISRCLQDGTYFDANFLREDLKTNKDWHSVVDSCLYFDDLIRSPVTAHVDRYIFMLNNLHISRQTLYLADFLVDQVGKTNPRDIRSLLMQAREKLDVLIENTNVIEKTEMHEAIANMVNHLNQTWDGKKDIGLETPFKALNQHMGGLQNKTLNVIAGMSGLGKTAFVVNFIHEIAVQQKNHMLFFSLEMNIDPIMHRLMALIGDVPLHEILKPSSGMEEVVREGIERAILICQEAPCTMIDQKGLTIKDIVAMSRHEKRLNPNLKCIVIDHLQHISLCSKSKENPYQQTSSMVDALKALGDELDIPIVLLSQLNRNHLSRQDESAALDDLMNSSRIGHAADNVIFLQRHEKKEHREQKLGYFNVAKCRQGMSGKILVRFDGSRQRWEEIEELGAVIHIDIKGRSRLSKD